MNIGCELFERCRQVSTDIHRIHVETKSYAAHMATGGFYSGIVDLADSFIESYKGTTDTSFTDYPSTNGLPRSSNPETVIGSFRKWVEDNRSKITNRSEIQNIIDEIVSLCNQTLYKLKQFK